MENKKLDTRDVTEADKVADVEMAEGNECPFCSKFCNNNRKLSKHIRDNHSNQYNQWVTIKVICNYSKCSKEFEVNKFAVNGKKYCSSSCATSDRNTKFTYSNPDPLIQIATKERRLNQANSTKQWHKNPINRNKKKEMIVGTIIGRKKYLANPLNKEKILETNKKIGIAKELWYANPDNSEKAKEYQKLAGLGLKKHNSDPANYEKVLQHNFKAANRSSKMYYINGVRCQGGSEKKYIEQLINEKKPLPVRPNMIYTEEGIRFLDFEFPDRFIEVKSKYTYLLYPNSLQEKKDKWITKNIKPVEVVIL
jgi:hypothetical protein